MLANKESRGYYSSMYNDEIMMLYILVAIYYQLKSKPIVASFFLTLGLSVKAGVILLIPAFLGSIQMFHGTFTLLKCITLIVGFQVVIALPFCLGESTVADYIHRSKLTGAGRNGVAGAAAFWDYLAAHQSLSIFWTFIPEETYFHKEAFSDKVKVGMMVCNIWHFFVRKWAIAPCFENLFATFDSKKTYGLKTPEQVRNMLEILLIGYICGIVLMPGANQQFQFWYISIVPLLLGMLPLPLISTIWASNYFFPITNMDPRYQHFFLLGLSFWLITVGPQKPWFDLSREIKVKQN
jgi:hypothetical protein